MPWTVNELAAIADADELYLATTSPDEQLRHPVTIWVVRVADDLYVRAIDGPTGKWYRHAIEGRHGRINSGGIDKDVDFLPDAGEQDDAIDSAYTSKYRRHGAGIVASTLTPKAQAATIRLSPRR